MDPRTFFSEARRRNVYKVAVAYIVASWALAQGIAQVFPVFNVSNAIVRLIVVLLIIGFPIALILAWAFELTHEGIKRTEVADAMPASLRPSNQTWIYIVVVGTLVSGALFFLGRYTAPSTTDLDRSIAVLPFESLSADKNDAFFADGVQDEILTALAKVADLRVISRFSAQQYKSGTERNLREIGRQLGVAYIVEGSVQRDGKSLRINAELIDARTDAHLWAESYDRTDADLFAIQSDLALRIVTQLKGTLSPKQKAEIEEPTTKDTVARELYTQAAANIESYLNATDVRAALLQSVQSLEEAVRRDPKFVSAYCFLARANSLLFFFDLDPTPDRVRQANDAVQAALKLRPDSSEAHFALADYDFRCLRDYDRAQDELAYARAGLPNNSPFFILSGYINRRRNHFPDAERDFTTAFALDPRNPNAYNLLADTFILQRRLLDAVQVYDRVLAAGERGPIVDFRRTAALFYGTGNSQPFRDLLAKYPEMEFAGGQTPARALMSMLDGNYVEAERFFQISPRKDFQDIDFTFYFPKSWYEGMIARAAGDSSRALASYRECREILVQRLVTKPDHARTVAVLAQVDASLGEKDLAVREAEHAIDLMPVTRDLYDGTLVLEGLAQVYTWTGDRDHAIEVLQKLITMPGYTNYGRLKLHPLWAPLRGDPRFEKIVAAMAPK